MNRQEYPQTHRFRVRDETGDYSVVIGITSAAAAEKAARRYCARIGAEYLGAEEERHAI